MSTRSIDAPNSQIAEILKKSPEAAELWNALKRINPNNRLEIVNLAFKDTQDTQWFKQNINKENGLKVVYESAVRMFHGKTWEDAQDFADTLTIWGAPEGAQIDIGRQTAWNTILDTANKTHRSKALEAAVRTAGDATENAVSKAALNVGLGSAAKKAVSRAIEDAKLYAAFLVVEDKLQKEAGKEVKDQIQKYVLSCKDAWNAGMAVLCDVDWAISLYSKDGNTYYYESGTEEKISQIANLKRDEPKEDTDKPFLWD